MNLTELREGVYRNLGGEVGVNYDVTLDQNHLTVYVNQALNEISTEHDWPWLDASETIATIAGTATYTPATNWVRTKELKVVDSYPMQLVGQVDLDTQWPTTGVAEPSIYSIVNSLISVRPYPDGVYSMTHRYVKRETELASGTDTPVMPTQFHGSIVARATIFAARRLRLPKVADMWTPDVDRWSKLMRDDQRRARGSLRVRIRPGLWQDVGHGF